jgi:hypothetical protein
MRRKALALTIISAVLFLALIGIQTAKIAEANPVYFTEDKTPPTVSILSPKNNETFSTNDVLLNFTVTKPDTWYTWEPYFPNQTMKGTLHSVSYQLDGTLYGPIIVDDNLISPFNCSVALTNLEDGVHSLLVTVNGTSLGGDYAQALFYDVPINGSSNIVYLTINAAHSAEPVPTTLVATASAATVGVVGVGLLIYFKKRKH